jgi:branched-subunit amino acid transport protein
MDEAAVFTYLILFFLIGCFTYLFRGLFLFQYPDIMNNNYIRKGLESVPTSLLVALVIPYALFVDSNLILFRIEVFAVFLTVIVLWYIKKPGLSLIVAMIFLLGLDFIF